jgi:hypothetical protein
MPDDQPTPTHAIAERSEQDADAEHYEPAPVDDIEWSDEPEEMPRRPRRRLLAPIPVALLAVLLLAGGFFAGVQVEKGQSSSSSTGAPSGLPAGLAALQRSSSKSQGNASSSGGSAAAGLPSGFPGAAGGAGGITTGEVSYVRGNTLYVTNSEGTTVKVHSAAGASVTKTVTTSAHKIHPGETVVVRGTTAKNGAVSASSISVSSSSTAGSTSSSSGAPTAGGGASALFGSGG